MSIEIRPAVEDDAPALQLILEQARTFKLAQGDQGWGTEPFGMEEITSIIKENDTFLATVDEEPAGTLQVLTSDPRLWGEHHGYDNQALYVHRFATADIFRGTGVGQHMLDWACRQVIDAGRLQLRLDCNAGNSRLREYYEKQSFWCVGEKAVGAYTAALHQRRV